MFAWPSRPPWTPFQRSTMADQSGLDRLVPPMPNQPAGVEVRASEAQYEAPAPRVVRAPVHSSAYGVYSSAFAETSGTSRQAWPSAAWLQYGPTLLNGDGMPGPCWYLGFGQ